jgi:toxin ParE1/3/4
MKRLSFHPEALAEFEAAAEHYHREQPGLGHRFVENVETALDRICAFPSHSPELSPGIRRCLVRVFPYAILHADHEDGVIVLAVMHCHRQPGYWRSRTLQP